MHTTTAPLTQFRFVAARKWRRTTFVLASCGLLGLASVLFFARLGERALWSMELRWAEIPREMSRTGDYFRPTINGKLYYDKPLGSYWLVLAASAWTGQVDEWTARLPSAISGLLGVVLLMCLARQLYDRRTALLAGLILATCFAYVSFARTASADLENVTGELAALAIFLRMRERPTGWGVVLLWLVMALTSLTKGLLGFALPLLVMITYCAPSLTFAISTCWRRQGTERRGHGKRWAWHPMTHVLVGRASLIGMMLALAVYLAPFVASGSDAESGLVLVFRENIQRFVAPHNHRGPVYLYAYAIFGLLAPWSVILPAALWHNRARHWADEQADADRFCRIFFWATFAFFTLSASRRSYYLLPVLPAGALLIARLLACQAEELTVGARRLFRNGFGVLTVAVVGIGVGLLPPSSILPGRWADLPTAPARPLLALGWLIGLGVTAFAWRGIRPRRVAFATGSVASLSLAYLFVVALPATEPFRGERPFTAEVRKIVGPNATGLALYRTRELVYYLDYPNPIAELDSQAGILAAASKGRVTWLVLRRRDLDGLALNADVMAQEPAFPWDGPRELGAKALLLRLRSDGVKSLY